MRGGQNVFLRLAVDVGKSVLHSLVSFLCSRQVFFSFFAVNRTALWSCCGGVVVIIVPTPPLVNSTSLCFQTITLYYKPYSATQQRLGSVSPWSKLGMVDLLQKWPAMIALSGFLAPLAFHQAAIRKCVCPTINCHVPNLLHHQSMERQKRKE